MLMFTNFFDIIIALRIDIIPINVKQMMCLIMEVESTYIVLMSLDCVG